VITLTQLEYIVAVQKHGNFGQAAKACFVTQPTLSMQIQKLEDDLGVQIFDRSSQPIRPTPIGQKILEQSQVVLAQTERIQSIIHEAKDSLEGELRLGVIPTLAPYLLPLFIDRFCKAYPGLHVQVQESKTDDIIALLKGNQLDIGLLATPLDEPFIVEHPIFIEPFYIYAQKGSALSELDDIKNERVLLLAEGHCLRTQMTRVCNYRESKAKKAKQPFDFESGSIETLCHLVEKGHGYTVIPHLARTWNATRAGSVIPFSDPRPGREVSLVVHRSFAREGLLRALRESIAGSLPPELRKPDSALKAIKLR